MQQQIDGGGGRRVEAARWRQRRQHSGGWFTAAFHYIKTFLNNKMAVSGGEDIHKSRQTGQCTVFDHASCLCAETWWRRTSCLLSIALQPAASTTELTDGHKPSAVVSHKELCFCSGSERFKSLFVTFCFASIFNHLVNFPWCNTVGTVFLIQRVKVTEDEKLHLHIWVKNNCLFTSAASLTLI